MRSNILLSFTVLSLFAITSLLAGCGSSSKEGAGAPLASVANAPKVGSDSCINTCHAATQDITMKNDPTDSRTIKTAWTVSVHHITLNGFTTVGCEDCHGGGGLHYGTGPMPYPVPDYARCQTCHKPPYFDAPAVFQQTAHANAHLTTPGAPFGPDQFFFQGSVGTDQASSRGVPEFVSGTTTPVTKNHHIEECSVCHNSNQQFRYVNGDITGNLTKPDPANMPNPTVSCASCHDAHQVGLQVNLVTRVGATVYPIFRKVQVNTATGANDAVAGTWIRPLLYQPNGVVQTNGSVDLTKLIGANNEITPEKLCASCHTVGTYKFGKTATHQTDVYSQYKTSGHGDRTAPAFGEFAANPPIYDPTFPTGAGSHQSLYPLDMSLSKVGATATATQNAGVVGNPFNNNFPCFKCHNGVGSIAWMTNTQGTSKAPVVYGDATVTCITCHDPHAGGTGHTKNVRTPVVMTNYSAVGVKIIANNFLDNQPVPSTAGNSSICIFCHQGRESGLTLFQDKLAPARTAANLAGKAYKNAHYLGTAAMLWGANAYEYAGKLYGVNASHQQTNCVGCHMSNLPTLVATGGHSWIPNPASCTTCHSGITSSTDLTIFLGASRATASATNYSNNVASTSVAQQIQDLQNYIIKLLAAQTTPVYYDDTQYPYFFNVAITSANGSATNHGPAATQFTGWTLPVYKAAFNLGIAIKGLPSAGTSTTYVPNGGGVIVPNTSATLVPNNSAAVHNYKYVIQLLLDSYTDLYNNTAVIPAGLPTPAVLNANRPVGTRSAVNYGAQVNGGTAVLGGTYNVNQ